MTSVQPKTHVNLFSVPETNAQFPVMKGMSTYYEKPSWFGPTNKLLTFKKKNDATQSKWYTFAETYEPSATYFKGSIGSKK